MTSITLRDGTQVQDPRLDRLIQFDERSRGYSIEAIAKEGPYPRPLRSYTWRCHARLDQLKNGACVWFALGHELNARPCEVQGLTFQWLLEQFHLSQHRDPWAGCYLGPRCPIQPSSEAYDGTSVLAGVKQAMELGHFGEYRWAFTLEEVLVAVGYFGPVVMGTWWMQGMADIDGNAFVWPTGRPLGGHAWLVRGVRVRFVPEATGRTMANVDLDASHVLCRNSWGPGWGANGDFRMTLRAFDELRRAEGEACVPMSRNLNLRGLQP